MLMQPKGEIIFSAIKYCDGRVEFFPIAPYMYSYRSSNFEITKVVAVDLFAFLSDLYRGS